MKWTPQNAITSASAAAACRDRPSESPTKSATAWTSGTWPAARGIHVLSTGGMLQHVVQDPDKEYVVATETGMLYPLTRAATRTTLTPVSEMAVCKYMKMITLPKLRDSLRESKFEVQVRLEIAERARNPIERMVAIG
jgi:quinolinate synthase